MWTEAGEGEGGLQWEKEAAELNWWLHSIDGLWLPSGISITPFLQKVHGNLSKES